MTIEKILEYFRLYAHDEYGEFVSDFMIKDFLKNYIPGKSARSDQFRERLEKIIKETSDEHPYSVTGRPETYNQYNQGWEDACDVLEQRIMDAYNEVHK